MKYTLMLFVFLLSAPVLAAGGFETVVGGHDLDRGIFIGPTDDGGYIAVGSTMSLGAGGEDVYLVRADSRGEVLWTRALGGTQADFGWSVHELADGFILAGFTLSFGNGDYDFYLVKTDSEGNQQWFQTYGGPGKDRCWAMALCGDGGFVLAGETTGSGAGEEDFYLVKTDSLGTVQWARTFGGEKSDRCFGVVQAADGGYVLAGQTFSEGAGDRDAFVVKTSPEGKMEWSRTFGGPASDVGHSIIRTSDDHFLVTGYTTSLAKDGDDPYLIKIDVQGKTKWTSVPSLAGIHHTLTGDEAAGGGFYLTGFSIDRNTGNKTALLVRTDPSGRLIWNRPIQPSSTEESFGYSVLATPSGGCVLTGHTSMKSAGKLDLLLVGVEEAED